MPFRFFVREVFPPIFVAYDQAHPEVQAEGASLAEAIAKLTAPIAKAVAVPELVEPPAPSADPAS